jgi:hypothetical protein
MALQGQLPSAGRHAAPCAAILPGAPADVAASAPGPAPAWSARDRWVLFLMAASVRFGELALLVAENGVPGVCFRLAWAVGPHVFAALYPPHARVRRFVVRFVAHVRKPVATARPFLSPMEIHVSQYAAIKSLAALATCALVAACASPKPVAYSGLASASYLKPNAQDDAGNVPYRYSTQVNWADYSKVIIDPVAVYQGADNQFGDMSENDRVSLSHYVQAQFTVALSKRFAVTSTPGPGTLRVKLTLTGAATSTPVLSTFAHLDIAGNLYNGVQAVRGKEGMMKGWVMYAAEVQNAATGQLLEAFETKQYPNAFNVMATFGPLAAAKTGVDKGAGTLVAQMR